MSEVVLFLLLVLLGGILYQLEDINANLKRLIKSLNERDKP